MSNSEREIIVKQNKITEAQINYLFMTNDVLLNHIGHKKPNMYKFSILEQLIMFDE